MIEHLELLKGDHGGFAVDRYTHCLQTAIRAMRDGRDEEYIVCALLHDIEDTLAPANHADFAATMLEPFISEKTIGFLNKIFQGYYFFDSKLDKNMRDKFKVTRIGKIVQNLCKIRSKLIQNTIRAY